MSSPGRNLCADKVVPCLYRCDPFDRGLLSIARGPLASGFRFLIITNASTTTIAQSPSLRKDEYYFSIVKFIRDTRGVILFYLAIGLSRSDIIPRVTERGRSNMMMVIS
jgi:hypothetical protein